MIAVITKGGLKNMSYGKTYKNPMLPIEIQKLELEREKLKQDLEIARRNEKQSERNFKKSIAATIIVACIGALFPTLKDIIMPPKPITIDYTINGVPFSVSIDEAAQKIEEVTNEITNNTDNTSTLYSAMEAKYQEMEVKYQELLSAYNKLVDVNHQLSATTSPSALGTLVITDKDPMGANIRSTPDRSSKTNIITTALKGVEFPYFEFIRNSKTKEGWYKIQLPDGSYGYVHANLVRLVS